MSRELQGKICIVTGGTEGIGLAIVERFLSLGASVLIANRSTDKGNEVISSLKSTHKLDDSRLAFQRLDIRSQADCKAVVPACVEKLGTVDVVVANAGYTGDVKGNWETDESDDYIDNFNGNVIGTMLLSRTAATYWTRTKKSGNIVITSSAMGFFPMQWPFKDVGYSTSKAALNAFDIKSEVSVSQVALDASAREQKLKESSIRLNTIMPGWVWTPLLLKGPFAKMGLKSKADFEKYLGKVFLEPNGGWTPMDKLVDAYLTCVLDDNIRGKSFVVNGAGGKMLQYPKPE
ncbi:hypothetical protein HDU93_001020, partial [Gonapodya sp. JEL0774]